MKTLIFMKESDLHPTGGPAGYCYNIFQELKRRNNDSIFFLPADSEKKINRITKLRSIISKLPKWINAMQIAFRRKKEYERILDAPEMHNVCFDQYDAVHFHSTIAMAKYRKDLDGYSGIVILSTHSPVPQHQEIYEELPTKAEKKKYRKFYERLSELDKIAFERADYVVFPCKEAEESYFKKWEAYASIHDSLEKRGALVYIPTGIEEKRICLQRSEVREKYHIKEDDFVISYVGRHNYVKGYDTIQTIAKDLWREQYPFVFHICGIEFPLHGLSDERWIEAGWTNDSQSVIAASDLFILPNRETYFDIVMLEGLAAGKIIVASKTGGNKYFEKIGAKGVFLYQTITEAESMIKEISNYSSEERIRLEEDNKRVFYRYFTIQRFVDEYIGFLERIG